MALDLGTLTGYLELDDDKFDETLDKLPGKLKGSSVAAAALGAASAVGIGAALGKGLEQGIDMDAANHKIAAQLGLSQKDSAAIGKIAGKLFADNYGDSIEDVNDAIATVKGAIQGIGTGKALQSATADALNFAKAMNVDVEGAAVSAGTLVQTGLADNASDAFDLLTAAAQKAGPAMTQPILDAVNEYSKHFQQLGIDGPQAMTIISSAASGGEIAIDKAADAVKEFGIRATDLNDTGAQASLKALGLNGQQMGDDLLAGGDKAKSATELIAQKLLAVQDPAKRAALAGGLFGTQIEDIGKNNLPGFLKGLAGSSSALGDVDGRAKKMGDTLNGSASAGIETMQRQWGQLIGSVGQKLLPALNAVLDVINKNPVVLQIAAVAFGILAAAVMGLSIATWAMNTALLANPITWIVIGIVALIAAIVLLIVHWKEVASFLGTVWGAIVGALVDGFNQIAGFFGSVWQGALDAFAAGWQQIASFFGGIGAAIAGFFSGAGQWLMDIGRSILDGLYQGLLAYLSVINFFYIQLPLKILGWLAAAGTWLLSIGQKVMQGFLSGVTGAWGAVSSWVQGVGGRIVSAVGAGTSWLLSTGRNVINGLKSGITGTWSAVTGWLGGVGSKIIGAFSGAGSWLYSVGQNIVNGLLDGVRSLASTIGSFFLSLLPGWIVGPFKAALGIHSPSRVFRAFGRNIAQGIPLGLDDEQANIDKRVSDLVSVPNASMASVGFTGAKSSQTGAQGRPGVSIAMPVYGNVGWMPDEVADRLDAKTKQAQQLEGFDTGAVVVP